MIEIYALWVGIAGLLLLLVAFVLEHMKQYRKDTFIFNSLNLAGSLMLGFYAWDIGSLVFLTLELVWAFAALYFLIKVIRKRRQGK